MGRNDPSPRKSAITCVLAGATQTGSSHSDEVKSVAYSPDGTFIMSASGDGTIKRRDPSNLAGGASATGSPKGGGQQALSVAISHDSTKAVSG